MSLKGQKERFDDAAQSKEGKEKKYQDTCFFLDTVHDQELSPSLMQAETHTFHLHLTGVRREEEHNFSAVIPRLHPLFYSSYNNLNSAQ